MLRMTYRHRFTSSEEVNSLAQSLSEFFLPACHLAVGIHELLMNAVEHGMLHVPHHVKAELLREGKYGDELTRLLQLPDNREKYITIETLSNESECKLSIGDPGEGFDWRACLDINNEGMQPYGRGLLIAMQAGFDSLTYNERGNRVTCSARLSHSGTGTEPSLMAVC